MGEDARQVSAAVAAEGRAPEQAGAEAEGRAPEQAGAEAERTPEQIEADIERTRQELGDTVAAVAEKADVKAQAKAKARETRERILGKKDEVVDRTRAAAPDSAGEGAATVTRVARDNRRALVIGGAVLVAFVLGRRSARE